MSSKSVARRRVRTGGLVALAVSLLVLTPSPAPSAVLCASKRGMVFLRDECRRKERRLTLDPSSIGPSGTQGPTGEQRSGAAPPGLRRALRARPEPTAVRCGSWTTAAARWERSSGSRVTAATRVPSCCVRWTAPGSGSTSGRRASWAPRAPSTTTPPAAPAPATSGSTTTTRRCRDSPPPSASMPRSSGTMPSRRTARTVPSGAGSSSWPRAATRPRPSLPSRRSCRPAARARAIPARVLPVHGMRRRRRPPAAPVRTVDLATLGLLSPFRLER